MPGGGLFFAAAAFNSAESVTSDSHLSGGKDLIDLVGQDLAVNAVYHAGLFQGFHLGSRAAQAVHAFVEQDRGNDVIYHKQFADTHILVNLFHFKNPPEKINGSADQICASF